jgi:citrate synthase
MNIETNGTTSPTKQSASGLDGVVAADTRLSDVDGERGQLIVAGDDIESLAGHVSFGTLAARLFEQAGGASCSDPSRALAEGRALAFGLLPRLGDSLAKPDGMDALRAAAAHLPSPYDGGAAQRVAAPAEALTVVGAIATFAAAWWRTQSGGPPIAPDASLDHASDYLRMLGAPFDAPRARAVDAYLVTVSDHGMNASTFAARVVASTGSDLVSSLVAAIGALKGPLHGGAPGPVLDMLDAVGAPDRAEAFLAAELDAGRRIMGMGHRIYRVRDPRAAVLERAIAALESSGQHTPRLALARAVESAAQIALTARHPDRPLRANVEFYTAVILDAAGLDRRAFSPTFAVGRAAGWAAHVAEQRAFGRLIRPASRYVGAMPAK